MGVDITTVVVAADVDPGLGGNGSGIGGSNITCGSNTEKYIVSCFIILKDALVHYERIMCPGYLCCVLQLFLFVRLTWVHMMRTHNGLMHPLIL